MGLDRGSLDQLRALIRPLQNAARNMIARGTVQLADDTGMLQRLQLGVLQGETVEGADGGGAEHFQPYGFTSVPLAGAEAIVAFVAGDRAHPIVIAAPDRRYRPTGGQAGQVTMYHQSGATVTMLANGDIVSTPGSGGKVRLGGSGGDFAVAGAAITDWLSALTSAITFATNNSPPNPNNAIAVYILTLLQTELAALNASQGWIPRTSVTKVQ